MNKQQEFFDFAAKVGLNKHIGGIEATEMLIELCQISKDKQKAVNEYVRVTKSGGYIGLNESTWLKVPPPPELIAWVSQDLGANVKPMTSGEWTGLLETAGLQGIITRTSDINVKD